MVLALLTEAGGLELNIDHDGRDMASRYSNEWVVSLEGSEMGEADSLAQQLGYENFGEVSLNLGRRAPKPGKEIPGQVIVTF